MSMGNFDFFGMPQIRQTLSAQFLLAEKFN